MHPTFNTKKFVLASQTVASNATAAATIDTLGHDDIVLGFNIGAGATTNPVTLLAITQSDSTDTSTFVAITGCVAGTDYTLSAQLTSVPAITTEAYTFAFKRGGSLKRYLRVRYTPEGGTQAISVTATMYRAGEYPITAANMGSGVFLNVAQ